ncbi:MAG: hypothetical protein RSD28_07465 [Lachnospiraceae bacterium]
MKIVIILLSHLGADGHFDFIEGYMGNEIEGVEMKFTIMSQDCGKCNDF